MKIQPTTRWRRGRLTAPAALVLLAGLMLGGCAGSDSGLFDGTPVFPPHRLQPVAVVVTAPLEPIDLAAAHRGLAGWHDSAARRRQFMSCVWQTGASGLTELTVPGTELTCLAFERSPLRPADEWIGVQVDSTGRTEFRLTDARALDVARSRGWHHVVVPRELLLRPVARDSAVLELVADVAVLDVLEGEIVWQGELSSGRMADELPVNDDGEAPELTAYETATYAWLLDLFEVMDRMRVDPADERASLSLLCQEPPPVFSLEN